MCVVAIEPKSSCECAHGWCEEFRKRHVCSGCGALERSLRERPVDVRVEYTPDASAVNFASPIPVGIIRMDFLALLGAEAADCLLLGQVLDRSGSPIPGFSTFVGKKPLVVRGGPESTRRYCDTCGRFVYYPLGNDYVMRQTLTGQPVYEGGASLVMTPELSRRIERGKWKGIYITRLPIRDEPLDGIECFPENYY